MREQRRERDENASTCKPETAPKCLTLAVMSVSPCSMAVASAEGQALPFACAFLPLSSLVTKPIGRLGGSGRAMSSRSASNTCLSRLRALRLKGSSRHVFAKLSLIDRCRRPSLNLMNIHISA